MSFLSHQLTDISQIEALKVEMGEKSFFEYGVRIYKHFASLKPGEKFDITKRVAPRNIDKFIKVICLYMIDFPGFLQINDEFTEIIVLR